LRLGSGAAFLAALRFYTPDGALPLCPFLYLTKLPCPFCGMTRALCALAKGEWAAATGLHPLSPLALAVIVALLAGWRMPPRVLAALGVVFFSFGILRVAILTL
jgi:hypothetical protein